MKRRDFIALLGSATAASAAWPLAVGAQMPRKNPRVGFIAGSNPAATEHAVGAFQQRLRELGYVEGQTFTLVERYAEGRQERLPELAVELVRLEVDVLVATTSAAVQAAMNATRTIPIVMAGGGDPVGLGFVASLARPGGNVTGPSMMNTEIIGKRMQLLKEVVPGLARVAVLSNSVKPDSCPLLAADRAGSPRAGAGASTCRSAGTRGFRGGICGCHARQVRGAHRAR